ncbi:hypothetical protein A1Q1_02550 [Trichosporon asahii var. asahii CBS 2479]|uniref:ABC transporter domain-containing protein n=1 Tax=Trichosporon asahii var. asahii (strain ATCC 90039 / CBS 2479 / JCM 2466 / KCTC 7840 / NBRC 103889/ NCYC 2677 / UAMH 7654) TaxID=1186058 RepID=J5QPF8_TRIAS|nr:hypothetical protein A1Q1_02550 [Trichosporon asahii var. asahii CBS 2479]EJT48418.1 hypothetical protein A1Q1_02550 [Trichosporon asahii var. asahii CBS 2479]
MSNEESGQFVQLSGMPSPSLTEGGSSITFSNLSYEVKNKHGTKRLVDNVSVTVKQGQMLAILGPSGAGKSTLLDVMSFRKKHMDGGSITLNNQPLSAMTMAQVSSYVEQDDQHLGVLTVRETITYAARLTQSGMTKGEIRTRVDQIITDLGLQSCADLKIGTPIQRGISGGQRRRVTVGTGLVTFPRVLFLDEPTSGLDSTSAREVMASIKRIAEAEGIIVIATIHAPSIEALSLFDKMMILAQGRTAFLGTLQQANDRCNAIGFPIPEYMNPANHLLDLVGTDFMHEDKATALERLLAAHVEEPLPEPKSFGAPVALRKRPWSANINATLILSERTLLNYSRNLLAYGVRFGMYLGMALLLATIWIRLGDSDSIINDRLSVHFFSVAFLGFMSVAGIPSFLEERSVFLRERKNGLYGPLPFVLSNTVVMLPFMFICAFAFSVIIYWAIGLHPGANAFWRFVAFLYLAVLCAEAQAQVIAALVPIFIAALALTAFMNGFWMCVQGYFIKARSLPRFWYYSFHFMDFQTFAFDILVKNDLVGEVFKCNSAFIPSGDCNCVYPASATSLELYGQCRVSGQDVIDYLEFGGISVGGYAGILVAIICIYRVCLYFALYFQRHP